MADGSTFVEQRIEALAAERPATTWVGTPASKLHELAVGTRAVVHGPTCYDGTVIRLLEMGLTPGTEVTLSRRAPSSDPIEVEVRGTRLCLRRADAAHFPVTVVAPR